MTLTYRDDTSRLIGCNKVYYPIDPWALEGVLFTWYDFNLRVSKNRKNRDGRKCNVSHKIQRAIVLKHKKASNYLIQHRHNLGFLYLHL